MSIENVKKIHEATMHILEHTGMQFAHPDAQKILREHGVRMEGDVAHFTEAQIMEWIGKAPSTFLFEGINPKYNVEIGGDNIARGVTIVTNIVDRDGTIRDATIEDYLKLQKLYEANPKIAINGGMTVDPVGIEPYWNDLVLNYASLCHSEKPLYTAGGNYGQMEAVIELTRTRFGYSVEELKQHCILAGLANPNSPLMLTEEATETILTFGKYNQPVVVCSAAMGGATSPITVEGTIVTTNAEVIGTLVLAQMANPGAPVIYGSASTSADMRTAGIAIGAPESALCIKYCAELARFYGVPSRAAGCLTDAKAVTPQAVYQSMMTYVAGRQNHVNFMLHAAGCMNGYLSTSFDKLIIDYEIMNYVDAYFDDLHINEETVPLDVIDEVGICGEYLTTDHTLDNYTEVLVPTYLSVLNSSTDPNDFYKLVDKRTEQLLAAYKKPEIEPAVLEKLQEQLRARGIPEDVIERCTV